MTVEIKWLENCNKKLEGKHGESLEKTIFNPS